MAEIDNIVQDLFKVVQTKKDEIAKAEKPNWETNCAFGFYPETSQRINLQVMSDVADLVNILAFLIEKHKNFDAAQEILGTNLKFKWLGFTFDQWKSDIKTRLDKIQISMKKRELNELEARLDKLVSPELKQQMELEEIKKLLGQ